MTYTIVSVYMPENSCRPKRGKGGFSFTRHPSERSDMYTKTGTTAFMDHILTLKKRKITGEFAHPLISRARKRPIASTGRQGNCHSACRASTECEAAQMRNAVSQPDTHSEAADASQASDQAEVCGPACPATPSQQIPQRSRGQAAGLRCADPLTCML